ncbi:MAG: helix-turn-helix domain-containing protein [Ignavibacteria bacterium]|nr:helix-turn-helix domain-containing protein [Ignavibacteria bacterium]
MDKKQKKIKLDKEEREIEATAEIYIPLSKKERSEIENTLERIRRQKNGWKFGDAKDFLNLSPEESAYIELKLALSRNLQETRKEKQLTQEQLARLLKSSQSRVAKMETGDPSVSLDLLIRSLLVLGTSRKKLARVFA